MDIQHFLVVLWRRKWIFLFVFLVTAGAAFLGASLLEPFYQTTAQFALREASVESSILIGIGMKDTSALGGGQESDVPNRIAHAKIAPILRRVMWKLQIRDGAGKLEDPDRLTKFSKLFGRTSLQLEQIRNSRIVCVRARSRDPIEAAMLANTLAEFNIDENRQDHKAEYREAREFVQSQLHLAKRDYSDALSKIMNFRLDQQIVDLEFETKEAVRRMEELLKEKERSVVDLAESRTKLAALRAQLQTARQDAVAGMAGEERNSYIERLKTMLSELESQKAGALAEKHAEHPDVKSLASRIESVQQQLHAETERIRETLTIAPALERDIAGLETRQAEINRDIEAHQRRLSMIPAKAHADAQLRLQYNVSESLYNALLNNLNQIGMAEAMTLANIKLISPALPPFEPAGPQKGLIRFVGMLVGLVTGLSLAFVVERLDDTIRNPDEASELSGLPLLGVIPKFRRRAKRLHLSRDPTDPISEAYRTIRNAIRLVSPDHPVRTLLVASPLAGEGKSTTVANLGISGAREGRRVLLIDTDLRQPQLHRMFKLNNQAGVTTVLADQTTVAQATQATRLENLWVLPGGPVPSDPGQIIESHKLRLLLEGLSKQYDLLILDSPPLLSVHDAMVLAGMVDGCVVVLECGKETRRTIACAKNTMARAGGIRTIGVVSTKFRRRDLGLLSY